ncbi:MAG: hypothetical protein AAF902_00840 [Chloroflexota bacterium]
MTQRYPEEVLTPTQIERRAQLKRYNRLTVYLPIVLMTIVIAMIVGLMSWLTVFPAPEGQTDWVLFVSGSADMIIILTALTLTLGAALIPILAAVWIWYTWQNPRPVERWLQKWLNKGVQFVEKTHLTVHNRSRQAADLSISINSSAKKVGHLTDDVTTWILPWRRKRQEERNK